MHARMIGCYRPNDYNVMFQMKISIREIYLCEGSWLTSTIHSLLSSLEITHIYNLLVSPPCQLSYTARSPAQRSLIKVDRLQMQTSLGIENLVALLSDLEVVDLSFHEFCQVRGMATYKPSSKVSYIMMITRIRLITLGSRWWTEPHSHIWIGRYYPYLSCIYLIDRGVILHHF